MAQAAPGTPRAGRTGLVVRIPEAEPAVRAWRERYDPSARAGVPAHVTVLFPFLDEELLDPEVHAALAEVLGARPAFDLRFTHCGRFPGVLHLAPEPDTRLRELTAAVFARWPQTPPYGGMFEDVVPHLTVAQSEDGSLLAEIESDVAAHLPLTARVTSVDLMVHDGTRWRQRASYELKHGQPYAR
ncbi:2'-5' RNA ligase family protein [Streptomyces sp. NBC_00249]|uniref:2'-5' RNA ligase family protein n=1 Tax=Streptomyces sp. NBC_00249 TaxID=2975690 RepID=UPI00224CB778|nr:2'-5' RNA ligase family protein [Streptomyces sp. NBC_00249]MCX5192590.1 2'-5' RNA ligase family protein [Streptomyces sp. NBC_00249]